MMNRCVGLMSCVAVLPFLALVAWGGFAVSADVGAARCCPECCEPGCCETAKVQVEPGTTVQAPSSAEEAKPAKADSECCSTGGCCSTFAVTVKNTKSSCCPPCPWCP